MDSQLSQRGKSCIHALRKSAGSQGQPKGKDRVLISHSLEGKSQEPPVAGGCETKRLSDPVKQISTLGIFARGSASM